MGEPRSRDDDPPRIFVYGTLRPTLGHPASAALEGHARSHADATLEGRLFHLGRYPGAVCATGCGMIQGELVELKPDDVPALLQRLDAYEGPEYVRRVHDVETVEGRRVAAWVYELIAVPAHARPITNGDWTPFADENPRAPGR